MPRSRAGPGCDRGAAAASTGATPAIGSSRRIMRGSDHQRPAELQELCADRRRACRRSRRRGGRGDRSRAARSPARAPRALALATRRGREQRHAEALAGLILRGQHHVLEHRHRVSTRGVWKTRTSPARATRRRGAPVNVATGEADRAAIGPHETRDEVEHRRLTGAVRTDQRGDRAFRHARSDASSTAATPPNDLPSCWTSRSSTSHFSRSSWRRSPSNP